MIWQWGTPEIQIILQVRWFQFSYCEFPFQMQQHPSIRTYWKYVLQLVRYCVSYLSLDRWMLFANLRLKMDFWSSGWNPLSENIKVAYTNWWPMIFFPCHAIISTLFLDCDYLQDFTMGNTSGPTSVGGTICPLGVPVFTTIFFDWGWGCFF